MKGSDCYQGQVSRACYEGHYTDSAPLRGHVTRFNSHTGILRLTPPDRRRESI